MTMPKSKTAKKKATKTNQLSKPSAKKANAKKESGSLTDKSNPHIKLGYLQKKLKDGVSQCRVCNHYCVLKEGEYGICGIRKNIKGDIYLMVYGRSAAANIDPIEKKPLFNFMPGTDVFTIGTIGCNLGCDFCQNWETAQAAKEVGKQKQEFAERLFEYGYKLSPEQIIKMCIDKNIKTVAFSYNEPTIFLEYALDTMKLAKKAGIKTVFVTNGFMSKESLDMMKGYLDAVNIDVKSFSEDFYKRLCKARLQPVLDNIKRCHEMGIWIEVTTLFIPGENDSDEEMEKIADFVASVDKSIPWHVTGFYPAYKMLDKTPTPSDTLKRAYDIGRKKLNYVYTGNIYDPTGESTYCPKCNNLLIERENYYTTVVGLEIGKRDVEDNKKRYGKEDSKGNGKRNEKGDGKARGIAKCNKCGQEIKGVFE